MFMATCPGPSIIFRPASPKGEPLRLTQVVLGAQNATVLNHLSVVGSLIEIDCPATAFARSEPLTPRPMSTPPPSTRGVKYNPEAMVKSPLHCHPPKMRSEERRVGKECRSRW